MGLGSFEPMLEVRRRQRLAVEVALTLITPETTYHDLLGAGFDALGHGAHAQAACHPDGGLNQHSMMKAGVGLADAFCRRAAISASI